MPHFKILILVALIACGYAQATETIHYFELKNRGANEVIPILHPLLQEHEAISGDGFQIFITTTSSRAKEIESILHSIDRAAKTFRISVTNDQYLAESQNAIEGSARIETGDATIKIGDHPYRNEGVSIQLDDDVSINAVARTIDDQRNNIQFINVQEGKPAFLSREKVRWFPAYSYVKRRRGYVEIDHGDIPYSSEDGFYVEARSSDSNHAQVAIYTVSGLNERYQINNFEQQTAETMLRVQFGRWFEIGGTTESSNRSEKGILYRTKEREERYSKIFLKIEVVN